MIRALRLPPALGAQPKPSPSSTTSSLQNFAVRAWARTIPTTTTTMTTAITARSFQRTFTHASRPRTSTSWKGRTTPSTTIEGTIARTQRRNFSWTWSRRSEPAGGKGAAGTSQQQQSQESLSLSGRLRKLSREYGWAAAGVYLALSVTDFPFCFLLVRWVGTDRIAEIEHWVVSRVEKLIPDNVKQQWHEWRNAGKELQEGEQAIAADGGDGDVKAAGWGIEQAQQRNKADASLATQLALAYAIHKSFIFVRVPLTAAITPKVVKVLRSWGWQIGKRKPKAKASRPSA